MANPSSESQMFNLRHIAKIAVPGLIVLAVTLLAGRTSAQPVQSQPQGGAFPYEYVNYTQQGHYYRIANAEVIVLGRVEVIKQIVGTEKDLDVGVWLRVESVIRSDNPGQKEGGKLFFRCLPLLEPYLPMQEGDRCLVLLERAKKWDDALILPTDMHYYPVSDDGKVVKFMKKAPTLKAPVPEEPTISAFLEETRKVLRETTLKEQAQSSTLVMIGTVTKSHQGSDEGAEDYSYVQVKPEKIYKGDPGEGDVTFVQRVNINRWTIRSLNRSVFKVGQRILCFANKDPTLSEPGPWNPEGETLWQFPHQRLSSLFIASSTGWRSRFKPIPLEQLYEDLEKWTEPGKGSH
jgi:hypothetical protein